MFVEHFKFSRPSDVRMDRTPEGVHFSWGEEAARARSLHGSRAALRICTATATPQDEVQQVLRELLLHVGIRGHVLTNKDQLRNEVPRGVAYEHIQELWSAVADSIPLHEFRGPVLGCYLDLQQRLQQIIDVVPDPAELDIYPLTPDPDGPKELLVRIGADGTRRWWRCIEVVNVCVERGHRVESWEPLALALASEKHSTLDIIMSQCGLDQATREGLQVRVGNLGLVSCRFVLCGDHMLQVLALHATVPILQVAMKAADSPSASKDGRYLCPYCDATPAEVRNVEAPPPPGLWPLRIGPRPLELLPRLPCLHKPPDLLHGIGRAVGSTRDYTAEELDPARKQAAREARSLRLQLAREIRSQERGRGTTRVRREPVVRRRPPPRSARGRTTQPPPQAPLRRTPMPSLRVLRRRQQGRARTARRRLDAAARSEDGPGTEQQQAPSVVQEGEALLAENIKFVQRPRAVFDNTLYGELQAAITGAADEGNTDQSQRLQWVLDLWQSHMKLCNLVLQRTEEGERVTGTVRHRAVYLNVGETRQLAEEGEKCLQLAHRLGWRLTPWMHVLWAHSAQFVRHWGSLWMFGCWGLEGRHRLVKRFYDVSLKATRQKQSCRRGAPRRPGRLGIGQVLQRCVVRTALKRLPNRRDLRSRVKPHAAAITDDAKQRAKAMLYGPNFRDAVSELWVSMGR
jgi:hypothetical protein